MSKRWNRTETWLTLGVLAIGLLILAISGLWMYMSATATPTSTRLTIEPFMTKGPADAPVTIVEFSDYQ